MSMDGESARGTRLIKSANVVEPLTIRSSCSKWKANENQKRILDSIFMSGLRHPSVEEIKHITALLQSHGPVESKNIACWFQNFNAKEKRKNGRPETDCRLTRTSSIVEVANRGSVHNKWKPDENQNKILGSSIQNPNIKEKEKNGQPPKDSRLARACSVVEGARYGVIHSKWKPNENQKKILGSNTQNPNVKLKRNNGQPQRDSRLTRSSSVVEGRSHESIENKWRTPENQNFRLTRSSSVAEGASHGNIGNKRKTTENHKRILSSNAPNSNLKEILKNGRPETGSSLIISSSCVESAASKSMAIENQKRILESSFISVRTSLEKENGIISELQPDDPVKGSSVISELHPHGPVEGSNVTNKDRKSEYFSASKWASILKPRTWNIFRLKRSSSNSSVQGDECVGIREEEVADGARRNSSEVRTSELFPFKSVKSP